MDMARVYKRADGSVKVCLGRDHGYSSFVFSSSGAIIEEGPPSDPYRADIARAKAREVWQFSRPEDDTNPTSKRKPVSDL
jgi:hypothetical protein